MNLGWRRQSVARQAPTKGSVGGRDFNVPQGCQPGLLDRSGTPAEKLWAANLARATSVRRVSPLYPQSTHSRCFKMDSLPRHWFGCSFMHAPCSIPTTFAAWRITAAPSHRPGKLPRRCGLCSGWPTTTNRKRPSANEGGRRPTPERRAESRKDFTCLAVAPREP